MFFNIFATILLILLYWGILTTKYTFIENAPTWIRLVIRLFIIFIQALIGAFVVMVIYNIWTEQIVACLIYNLR